MMWERFRRAPPVPAAEPRAARASRPQTVPSVVPRAILSMLLVLLQRVGHQPFHLLVRQLIDVGQQIARITIAISGDGVRRASLGVLLKLGDPRSQCADRGRFEQMT